MSRALSGKWLTHCTRQVGRWDTQPFSLLTLNEKILANVSCCGGSTKQVGVQISFPVPGWEIFTIRKYAGQGGGREGRPLERSRRVEDAYREGAKHPTQSIACQFKCTAYLEKNAKRLQVDCQYRLLKKTIE